jgi:hypothetical protein
MGCLLQRVRPDCSSRSAPPGASRCAGGSPHERIGAKRSLSTTS